jgi:hypothetical protein
METELFRVLSASDVCHDSGCSPLCYQSIGCNTLGILLIESMAACICFESVAPLKVIFDLADSRDGILLSVF